MKFFHHFAIPPLALVVVLVTGMVVVPAPAQEACDLSFTSQPCDELPCPAGDYEEKSCVFPPGASSPFPNAPPYVCHPYPQQRPAASKQCTEKIDDGHYLTRVNTGEGVLPPSNPFDYKTFPGTNLLPTVYTNTFDRLGDEMPNTLPSTPYIPYNLHDGDPVVEEIDPRSPLDDLRALFDAILEGKVQEVIELHQLQADNPASHYHQGELEYKANAVKEDIRSALDILEGEPVPYRNYSGLPVLHYMGPEKTKKVVPILDDEGNIIGGNVDVHQIWYWQHIEADTAYIDPTPIMFDKNGQAIDVPWTVTYTVDVLNRGHDDFSPFVTYFDLPDGGSPKPLVGMDQSFFNMEDGTRTIFKIKMTYAKYMNLVYTWGWRMHPPRIQVMENARKTIAKGPLEDLPNLATCPAEYEGCSLPELEQIVFCEQYDGGAVSCPLTNACTSVKCQPGEPRFDADGNPTACEQAKLYAISRIGDASPAKRMWTTLREALVLAEAGDFAGVRDIIAGKTRPAFLAWHDRTHLPCFERSEDVLTADQPLGHCVDPCLEGEPGKGCRKGLDIDGDSDITILYVNNTIYGQLVNRKNPNPDLKAGGWVRWPEWETRWQEWKAEDDRWKKDQVQWEKDFAKWEKGPKVLAAPQPPRQPVGPPILHVTAYNDDNFTHGYTIADFGGNRGWENQFKSSVKVAGSGCWFTFGRAYWGMSVGSPNGMLCVPPADDEGKPGLHKFEVQFNYEPSRRIRFYQFDPMHHDVAIYSIH